MRTVATIELCSDGDHLYARPKFYRGWTWLHGTTRPMSGWLTLPLDPATAVLRGELEELLTRAVREVGACWEYEVRSRRSRLWSQHGGDEEDQADDHQQSQ